MPPTVEVDDLRAVRNRAQRLLETHALRAADSLQLAAEKEGFDIEEAGAG